MLHRGPDEQRLYENGNVSFYFLRLAIQAIQTGSQPMGFKDRYIIVFNGEIYNHQELRKTYNLNCATGSDTETLLHLYDQLGKDCLNVLDGMFALAIYDREKKEIFLARDRAGKKPLYIYQKGAQFVFASELNCLKSLLPLEIDEDHIRQYFRLGYFFRRQTPYKNVEELPGGSYATIQVETGLLRVERWWNIHHFYLQPSADSFDTALNKVDEMLHRSVRRRIEASDLEVGSFLSGGIDSGLATAIGSEYNSQLRTFTVSFDGEYDEAPLAALVAKKYGTRHTEIQISYKNLVADVEGILLNYGEPFFDSSDIPSYYVSKEAKKYLTVILNGDGADELFGGYRRYVPFARFDFFKKRALIQGGSGLLKLALPPPRDKRSYYNYVHRLIHFAHKTGLPVYLSATGDIFDDYEWALLDNRPFLPDTSRDFDQIVDSPLTGLQKIMNLDFDFILFCDLLVKMDIATMAHSLEGRSPFLGKELLEYAPTLPDKYKINGVETKHILRTLTKKYLPPELVHQPKRGFEIPLKKWVDGELKEIIMDYIRAPDPYYARFIQKKFIEDVADRKIPISDEKRAKMLWLVFSLEVWHKNFLQTS